MLTSSQIRQGFLDFFREKKHTIVPSSSLMPDSPNLLFTNAGMNQFVPIFLGERSPDVSAWGGAIPGSDTRAADTQKCIRAGGKHNDLDDVGFDTYHHTFFEMLGNWSFGDYFKKEAIAWSWELIVERWKFPPQRVYATIYQPDQGDPAERDEEAWNFWAEKFRAAGLDPAVHIVNGNKKDNFWMMGETGPCGPCSELHIDLTPAGDTRGALVNKGTAECIEIWNLVFIQFNAQPSADSSTITFAPLPACHVDTGMGFERVASIIQGTKGFTDFANAKISNYETDIFRPIFDELEKMSGHRYGGTLPGSQASRLTAVPDRRDACLPSEQEKADVAMRVIADHIRTLSFAIADGIQPGNTDRNYVLRRILRRAVRYGRSLGFSEPFFYKLVATLAREMGGIFPNLRERQKHVEEVLKREEEAFNKTLDRGIAIFEAEVARLAGTVAGASGRVGVPPAGSGILPERTSERTTGVTYTRRHRLPHFEQPWAIYALTITTSARRKLTPAARTIVLDALRHFHRSRYELFAACVMPDHVHVLLQPWVKEQDDRGEAVFWPLGGLMHSIKSFTAKEINKAEGTTGTVWEQERFDRYVRGDRDLEEKFRYILGNPVREGLGDEYPWVWSQEDRSGETPEPAGGTPTLPGTKPAAAPAPAPAELSGRVGVPPAVPGVPPGKISGVFAFTLYDTYGFPLDLTELMARERGLTVDTAGFEKLMDEQRARARAAQKKQIIELSEIETKEPTKFVGYEMEDAVSEVREIVAVKGKTAVIVAVTPCYAEMGGQVGDTGTLSAGGCEYLITNTIKVGGTWLHYIEAGEDEPLPEVGAGAHVLIDQRRRDAIQRHHTVTHLLHWALHEVVSREATQKGSFVGPDKLTFDFNSAALTPAQVRDLERLVNERIVDNAPVAWTEVPYADVRGRGDIMQFFGDKYGETVRVVEIGGYSKELCAGTHTRATGEIGLFRIASEAAIAAGVRRIEAQAGLNAYDLATADTARLHAIAAQLGSPLADLEKRLESSLAQQKALEKALQAASQREAAGRAKDLLASATTINGIPAIIANLGTADGDTLQTVADALKSHGFTGVTVLGGCANGAVTLVASVSADFTAKVQAGKIISAIAPLVGGKGGGKPEHARGGGKDPSKLDEALAQVRALLG